MLARPPILRHEVTILVRDLASTLTRTRARPRGSQQKTTNTAHKITHGDAMGSHRFVFHRFRLPSACRAWHTRSLIHASNRRAAAYSSPLQEQPLSCPGSRITNDSPAGLPVPLTPAHDTSFTGISRCSPTAEHERKPPHTVNARRELTSAKAGFTSRDRVDGVHIIPCQGKEA